MRVTAALGLALVAGFAAPLFAAQDSSQPFLGEWTATADSPAGKVSETLTVVKTDAGYAIAAKLVVPPSTPEAGPGTDIVLDGDRFSYKRTATIPGGSLVITYSGVVSGDTFTGTVDLGGFGKMPYNGVRIRKGS